MLASIMNKLAVVRSLSHANANHVQAALSIAGAGGDVDATGGDPEVLEVASLLEHAMPVRDRRVAVDHLRACPHAAVDRDRVGSPGRAVRQDVFLHDLLGGGE